MAADRLSNFKLVLGIVIKADEEWRASDGLKLQCITIATLSSITFKAISWRK